MGTVTTLMTFEEFEQTHVSLTHAGQPNTTLETRLLPTFSPDLHRFFESA